MADTVFRAKRLLSPAPPSLLQTKLHTPLPSTNLAARPRLINKLHEILTHRLTLISAPAGFGKTTLLGEWIQESKTPVAWISLDESDNDPTRLWIYLLAALQRLDPSLTEKAAALQPGPQQTSFEAPLTVLINDLDLFASDFVLVLDDYHVIENPAIHKSLSFLLEHLPPRMHLVLSTRADPPIPLAQLRARSQLAELRARDLRFTSEEAATFLNQVAGLALTPDQLASLETRTEGWIAGLQLAALSLRDRQDISIFIEGFTGSHRFVLDYLAEQVLQDQPEAIQSFLLQTSILARMTAPLCAAVTGISTSQALLEELDQRNIFIIPLDEERHWYRYHHLFADFLQYRLRENQPEAIAGLHCRASEWLEREGLIAEAISHRLAARDWEVAARLIQEAARIFLQSGEIATLGRWMAALSVDVRREQPGLLLAYARALVDNAEYAEADQYIADAGQALADHPPTDAPLADSLSGQLATLRAHLAMSRGEYDQAIELSRRAQTLLPMNDAAWRSFVALTLAGTYRFTSNWEAASEAYEEASRQSQAAGNRMDALTAICMRGEVMEAQGHLRASAQEHERALELAQTWHMTTLPATGYSMVGLGRLWHEWNELDLATIYVQQGIERGKRADNADILLRGYIALSRICESRNKLDEALLALDDADPVIDRMGVSAIREWVSALRAQLWLAQGDQSAALRWAAGYKNVLDDAVFPSAAIALARVRLVQGETAEALRVLDHALHSSQQVGRLGNAIQIRIVRAIAHYTSGDSQSALVEVLHTLELAEPEGYVRVFVDEGAPLLHLLQRVTVSAAPSPYLQSLLAALGAEPPPVAPNHAGLIEPLSTREIEVLRLLAEGATNQEIADRLVIALNTVKKHTTNIYGKLGVGSRVQAIARARELKLL